MAALAAASIVQVHIFIIAALALAVVVVRLLTQRAAKETGQTMA